MKICQFRRRQLRDEAENNVVVLRIPLTTIDRLVSELASSKVGMIKMDIKGATERALTGGRQTLASSKPRPPRRPFVSLTDAAQEEIRR
jgi:hypothetical protein